MSDLIEDPIPGGNAPEYSVTEISGAIKRTVEGAFGRVRVRGEVGRVMLARSGHLYFDLKDQRSVLSAVSWKGQVARLTTRPEEGMEVIATGKLTTFGSQSRYQLNVDDVAIAGQGALMAMLEQRKKKLAAEGLFEPSRKQPLPYLPDVIGVITSPSGAVIRDILHRLRDRFARHVVIWPVPVQGKQCAPEVAAAIAGFNRLTPGGAVPRPDLLIVARGGGSVEDLWGFNEEAVVRAAAASSIPLISAIGHETDTTLIDFASDLRAPTPTAAAEAAVPVCRELQIDVARLEERRRRALAARLETNRRRVRDLGRGLPAPLELVRMREQILDHLRIRLPNALGHSVAAKRAALARLGARMPRRAELFANPAKSVSLLAAQLPRAMERKLAQRQARLLRSAAPLRRANLVQSVAAKRRYFDRVRKSFSIAGATGIERRHTRLASVGRLHDTLGYRQTLARGFAVVFDAEGSVISRAADAGCATRLEIELQDGRLAAKPVTRARNPAKKTGSDGQGQLF